MANDHNPYAPPANPYQAPGKGWPPARGAPGPDTMWREGELAVMYKTGGRLPDRCVRCNEAVSKRLAKTLFWHPPAVYFALLCGALPYIIVSLIMRKTTNVDFGLCEAHASQRLLGILLAVGGFIGGFALFTLSDSLDSVVPVFAGLAILIVGPLVGVFMSRVITVKRIDEEYAYFNVGRPFLESLPRND